MLPGVLITVYTGINIMIKPFKFMKSVIIWCLFLDKDIEIEDWTCWFFWFAISVIIMSETYGYIKMR